MPRWPRNWWVLVGVALVGLLAGALLGGRTEALQHLGVESSAPDVRVSAGEITTFQDDTSDGTQFLLPVFNETGTTIDVRILGISGLSSGLTSLTLHDLRSRTWRGVRFSAPANCDRRTPLSLGSVRLQVLGPDGRTATTVPLPDQGRALLEYQHAVCATPQENLTRRSLTGVWLVDGVYAGWPTRADAYLMRFEAGGRFVADPRGGLFSGKPGVRGSYRLDGELLTISVTGGYGCKPGQRAVWRAGLQADGRLRMVWVSGSCPEAPESVWLARRVLRDDGLP